MINKRANDRIFPYLEMGFLATRIELSVKKVDLKQPLERQSEDRLSAASKESESFRSGSDERSAPRSNLPVHPLSLLSLLLYTVSLFLLDKHLDGSLSTQSHPLYQLSITW